MTRRRRSSQRSLAWRSRDSTVRAVPVFVARLQRHEALRTVRSRPVLVSGSPVRMLDDHPATLGRWLSCHDKGRAPGSTPSTRPWANLSAQVEGLPAVTAPDQTGAIATEGSQLAVTVRTVDREVPDHLLFPIRKRESPRDRGCMTARLIGVRIELPMASQALVRRPCDSRLNLGTVPGSSAFWDQ